MRSGNEPMTARSALRLRLVLAVFGAVAAAAAATVLGLFGQIVLAAVLGAVAAAACVNVAVVAARIRQGPRFQPGRDVPPLRAERSARPRQEAHPLALVTRKRIYLAMMSVCLVLLVLAWALIYRYSVTAALAMSVAALAILPVAAIIANAGSANRR